MADRLPDWLRLRRHGEYLRFRICGFYAASCLVIGLTANAPWLFGRYVTTLFWMAAGIMFVVVGIRPGYKRRRTLVTCIALACSIRALSSVYPVLSVENFLLRGFVYLMLAVALTHDIASPSIHEHDRL